MAHVILIAGTFAWRPGKIDEWFCPDSPFVQFLIAHGVTPDFAADANGALRPFCWSTEIGGIGFGDDDLRAWHAAGINLFAWVVPPRCPEKRTPPAQTNIIAHSHGLQVALYAAAEGLQINTLISVGSPIRKDMRLVTAKARPNIRCWIHLHSDRSDRWQWLGELFDGKVGVVREAPLADRNDFTPGVGHSAVLTRPQHFHFWQDRGWLSALEERTER